MHEISILLRVIKERREASGVCFVLRSEHEYHSIRTRGKAE